ncbi:run domain Beclin-1-interacting and cysteine-rich domain-containing protein-like isoform X3 [Littorina saxatilis]|uniref:run domain Beclin-1-interacting and cysteine-rich domain-containing protein-like isoform X3 n=1 Tax=Littorina saxatilis TaxID=31220 RepID=UPI0038B5A30F
MYENDSLGLGNVNMADTEDDNSESWPEECHHLLMGLKCTVERLLAVQTSNVWSTYGGFKRVSSHIEAILCHRIKVTQITSQSEGVFWSFVRGLKWLRPGMTSTMDRVSRSSSSAGQGGKGQLWLRESLQDHSLSSQLEILVSDPEHLHYHYQEGAFLRSEEYVTAMLICLRAVESNKVVNLADINPKLLQPHRPARVSDYNPTMSGANTSSSFDPHPPSHSAPDLDSSPSSTERQLSMDRYNTSSGSLASAVYTSMSTSPPQSSSPSAAMSPLPHITGFYDCVHPAPLMEVEYGSSPPFQMTSSTPYQSSVSDDLVPLDTCDRGDVKKAPLRKCKSESFPGELELEAKPVTSEVQKKIHIPVKESRKVVSGTWHGVRDQRRPSSETKSDAAAGTKGHKRSQSDMGVGTTPSSSQPAMHDVTFHSEEFASTVKPPLTEAGGQTNKRDQRVSLHRGDSLFQPPAKGQSLMSYLSEQDFNYCALLEKENAHFGISDVLISVFEQMKWETSLRKYSLAENVSEEEESDEEINELKQRIRIRRRERLVEKAKIFPANSDGMNGTNTTSSMFTASSPVSSHGFSSLSDSSEQSDDADDQIELNFSGTETSNLAKLRSSGLSLSMASLYSDAELKKSNQSVESRGVDRQSSEKSNFSAEAIAMSLLSQFSEKRLPKASELEWLVSEKDAPQALLPLPNSFPISPDDGENADLMIAANKTKLRGNLEWAPPRAQIIFTIHQQEKRSVVLSRQNMRCAGCGTKAEHAFVRRLRYCEYVGKYFCQCCHGNDTEVIPGRVIMRWDFTRYYVSNFARDLLRKIRQQPLFHVDAINPALYKRVRTLDSVRDLRRQLGHLNTLLNICKRNDKWLEEVNKLPRHWTEDDNLYSLEDFAGVRSGEMPAVLKNIVAEAVRHVDSCTLCQGLGFICEICQGTDVIFPFQLSRSTLCPVCQACYHKSCYIPGKCPKCSRIELRRKRQSQMSPVETLKRTVWEGGGTRDSD